MRFVNANVFIYILIRSPKEDCLVSKDIFKGIGEAITSTSIIQEVVDWLEYKNRREEAKKFLTALNSYAAMKKVEASWTDMLNAISGMEKYSLDFINALTLQIIIYANDRDPQE